MREFVSSPYGYKVCYVKKKKHPRKRFITKSYKQAVEIKQMYYRYPPPDESGKDIVGVKWKIYPITKKEVQRGIWRECPF